MLPIIVVMGVAGSGKTTVGRLVADRVGVPFVDADDHHSPAAKAKIAADTPLTDEDRWPWLDRLHRILVLASEDRSGDQGAGAAGVVLACSALRDAYRQRLLDGIGDALVVFLHGDPALMRRRLAERRGHFAGPELLDSQLATLEEPAGALRLDVAEPPEVLADWVVRTLEQRG